MSRPPIHPGTIDWSGENPGLYLKEREDGPFTCLASFFRVVVSPHGFGHAAVILLDPAGQGGPSERPNACYTDNPSLARYLLAEFVPHFGAFKGNPRLDGLAIVDGVRFSHQGDHRSNWTERIEGNGLEISLTWGDFAEPFFVQYDRAHSATGRHEMFSVFVPGQTGAVVVNGLRGRGQPVGRDVAGKQSTTAFLAFSETWIKAPAS
jgi:hypothetical protein